MRPLKRGYKTPSVVSERSFETNVLACAKGASPSPGSHHFYSAYDTFTGHLGPGFGVHSSQSGAAGIGFGPGGTSNTYAYSGMCLNWVTLTS